MLDALQVQYRALPGKARQHGIRQVIRYVMHRVAHRVRTVRRVGLRFAKTNFRLDWLHKAMVSLEARDSPRWIAVETLSFCTMLNRRLCRGWPSREAPLWPMRSPTMARCQTPAAYVDIGIQFPPIHLTNFHRNTLGLISKSPFESPPNYPLQLL